MQETELGLMHFWQAGDAVTHAVAYLLLAMSVVSWYLILYKTWAAWRQRRRSRVALERFWAARSIDEALATLRREDAERVLLPMAEKAVAAARTQPDSSLGASVDKEGMLTRVLRGEIDQASAKMESGLTFLASVGSTAPFVGLFGTVWGIYHALIAIASSGQVLIEKVAGPVGEALIMTAAGLAVAIPAVLAYNAFVRINRIALAELDGFAHDLLALLLTGARLRTGASQAESLHSVAPLAQSSIVR